MRRSLASVARFAACVFAGWAFTLAGFAAPAETLGPEMPLAVPKGGYAGRLVVTPDSAPAGARVIARGEKLPPGANVHIVWRTVKGRWKAQNGEYHGREYQPVGYRIGGGRTNAAGEIQVEFTAPEDFGFQHDIVIQQGERLLTQTGFNLEMSVRLFPESGPVGTPITVEVKGIGWRQMQNSWMLLYDNHYTGWISAVTTGGSARFTIPAAGTPGVHVLEVLHGDFTFAYRNMQQSPQPDRPTFALRFTVTEGAPVLPPAAGRQRQTAVRGLPRSDAVVSSPAFAAVGSTVTVRADELQAEQLYRLRWATVTGNRVAGDGGWEESSRIISEARSDPAGRVAFRFEVPDDLGGAHTLTMEGPGRKKEGVFWIVPSAQTLDVQRGPAGTRFTVRLKGVGWTETANIYAINYDNNYIGYACGFNSQGDVEIHLIATGSPGWHFIDLYPAIYKGKETRPINFRIPQLTALDDHPGEDLPVFRFAFEVTAGRDVRAGAGR